MLITHALRMYDSMFGFGFAVHLYICICAFGCAILKYSLVDSASLQAEMPVKLGNPFWRNQLHCQLLEARVGLSDEAKVQLIFVTKLKSWF